MVLPPPLSSNAAPAPAAATAPGMSSFEPRTVQKRANEMQRTRSDASSSEFHEPTNEGNIDSIPQASNHKKKKKAKTNETSGTFKKKGATAVRAPNYSEDEDFFIACAYSSVLVDPIKGVGQKTDTFWTRVYEKFHLLSAKHFSNEGVVPPMRNRDSIEQRWKKKSVNVTSCRTSFIAK